MQAVKSKNTAPEGVVRRTAHALGYRFRLHRNDLPGKPDLVFPRLRKVLFVNGCFWHGHQCKRGNRPPKTNADYWRAKIRRNAAMDAANTAKLNSLGWQVGVIWECQLKQPAEVVKLLSTFLEH
jgi:DNA mismatch endonuclease (patch repair protein)